MTTAALARLRSLAEAATPGPWESVVLPSRDTGCSGHQHAADVFGRRYVRTGAGGYPGADLSGRRAEADAAFIAALDPQTVLALLDAAALSLAWNRVEAALPEGYGVSVHGPDLWGKWIASAAPNIFDREATDFTSGDSTYRGQHDSQLAALDALAEKLEARNA